MNRCPITYELCEDSKYSIQGIHLLSRRMQTLNDFAFTAEEQRQEAALRATKISIQGVQPKLSARLNIVNHCFDVVDTGGQYILKPQHPLFRELPENEDVTMRMAQLVKIEVPFHGMVYSKDESRTYFIRRFDRLNKGKVPLEDFAQLAGKSRETKYNYTMEKVVELLDRFCTFPIIEKANLFRRTIFNYLVGNEDMHLKNFSLITRNSKIELAPAYDFLNSTIVLKNARDEMALTLKGKLSNFSQKDLWQYYGEERLGLNQKVLSAVLADLKKAIPKWFDLLEISFLSKEMKDKYSLLLDKRCKILP